jgi:hypothetical protein
VEGLLAKGATSRYLPGRRGWLKYRATTTTEAIVGGVTGTLASSVVRSAWMASSRHLWRPSGWRSDHPSSVSTALYPRATSSRMTLDFPVPDIPVRRIRFTFGSVRAGTEGR